MATQTVREVTDNLSAQVIRTAVPAAVGALVTFLATMNITLDTQLHSALLLFGSTIFTVLYYTLIAKLEKKFPGLSVFLGSSKMPVGYAEEAVEVEVVEEETYTPRHMKTEDM